MNSTITTPNIYRNWRRWVTPIAGACLLAVAGMPAYAGHHVVGKTPAASATAKTPPNVPLPFTFTCPHCSMKITIKTPADWYKDCFTCACGQNNLGCYNDTKKK